MKNYLGQKVKNANGNEYLVLGCVRSKNGFEKALLQLVQVENSVKFVEYVVVRDYNFESLTWGGGRYYTVFNSGYSQDVCLEFAEKELMGAVSDYFML